MEAALSGAIYAAHAALSSASPPSLEDPSWAATTAAAALEDVAVHLARETMKLHRARLLDDLDAPLRRAFCSFVRPAECGGGVRDVSGGTRRAAWDAGCGGAFGHELTLARTLLAAEPDPRPFEVVKNARGGTSIHEW